MFYLNFENSASSGRKGRGSAAKRGRGRTRGKQSMVLEDDDDRDYIDYESPEELPVYDEEDEKMEEVDDQEQGFRHSQLFLGQKIFF